MSKQTIGPRELALRAQREANVKPQKTVKEIAAGLPKPDGKKPVKRRKRNG